jgi:hypothetical protein
MEFIHPPIDFIQRKEQEKITVRRETLGTGNMPVASFESPGLSSYGVHFHVFCGHLLPSRLRPDFIIQCVFKNYIKIC